MAEGLKEAVQTGKRGLATITDWGDLRWAIAQLWCAPAGGGAQTTGRVSRLA